VADALDPREAEALLLAEEIGADLLTSDDAPARAEVKRTDVDAVGTVGISTEACNQGFVPAALALLLELRRLGQWMSEGLLQAAREEEAGGSGQ
jgi:predicted nucleic acid-binding protein